MCGSNSCMHSSAEETIAAEDGLLIYCKPVELYNILHRRALKNPLFLQRCLRYKIEERRRWRLQLTISLVSTMGEAVQTQDMFPLYFLLAKPLFDTALTGHSAVYHLIQSCVMTSFNEIETKSRADANFILPEINKFSLDVKAGKLTVLLVSFGDTEKYLSEEELSKAGNVGGYCLWGKIPVESLCNSSERCVNLTWGHRVEMLSNVDMRPCYLEPSRFEEGSPITFQTGWNPGFMISKKVSQRHVQVNIAAKLVGQIEKSPYESFAYKNIPSSTLSNIIRLRAGNVIFNYRDRNNMLRKTEVTEDFACPFCLVQCACFKGLQCHLISSHDLLNFEFWVTEEYQAVNVSVKNDFLKSETIAEGADPKLLPFLFCSKSRMRRRPKDTVQKSKNVYPLSMGSGSPRRTESTVRRPFPNKKDLQNGTQAENNDSDIPNARDCIEHVASSLNILGVDPECVPSVSGSDPTALIMLPCAKSRKISLERSDSRNRVLLKKKRQFFHSHRAQPMTLEEVLSDRDSEDELDDDIADFEDRRMLDDFVDVTKDEKHLMHLWNSFVRKQRVLADGHVPWACEAFSKHHGQELVEAPPLLWCWRLFMIKLWNHSLVDARTMNNCNIILQEFQTQTQ